MDDEILTTEEVATLLKMTQNTLYIWTHRRTGPRSFKAGRHRRYLRSEVNKWIARQMSLDATGLDDAGEQ
jgi:excisionase family DNA binding protein